MERSIPNTWAAAILDQARRSGNQTRWSTTLMTLDNLVANPVFARIAFQTSLSRNDLFRLVTEICADLFGPEEENLIRLLADHRRLRMIGRIRRRYEELRDHEAGIVHVLLITATPMDGPAYEHLLPALNHRFGSGLRPHFHLDPDMMGGMIIRTGDQVLDVSARSRLARLARALNA